jgi:hypothetical protein
MSLSSNLYGAVVAMMFTVGQRENRL